VETNLENEVHHEEDGERLPLERVFLKRDSERAM
jgi:hypothetical protein